jgi:hypothetical protein
MAQKIFQIQISLNGFKPKIWRRIQLKSDTLLPDLHDIIQITMGWKNYHLHQFIKNREFYAEPSLEDEMGTIDYSKIKLSAMLKKEKDSMKYEYDFGDGWIHTILLEKILPVDPNTMYPVCLAGKLHCPPEDCGGVWGYSDLLEILKDPKHEDYEDSIEWLGDDFDPNEFNLELINAYLTGCSF